MAAVRRCLFLVVLGLTLNGCSKAGFGTTLSATGSEMKPFEGWGPFAFGMTIDDALRAQSDVAWDLDSVRKCRDEMSVSGCTLSFAEGSRVTLTAGVALMPRLVFNQEKRLASVRLGNIPTPDRDPAHCERAFGQLLDDLHDAWGAPTARSSGERGALERSTPKGRAFFLGSVDGAVVGRETFHVQPDGRQIVLRFDAIGATNSAPATCHLSIDYRGPERFQPPPEQRPYPLKNWL